MLCALFWKRCNWQGALAGMLAGGLMVFVWKYLISPLGGVFSIYELLPAFLTSLLVCVVVSLVTPPPRRRSKPSLRRRNKKQYKARALAQILVQGPLLYARRTTLFSTKKRFG